ncbi:hypothetical protein KR51_00021820 [Rubidibacter lacunae KORDI 51-2]|uniref:Prepilin-type N-terminal cleavage/methylation domain protein n=1 Tax=Rubidibacter lacunae KORDI 51-2 TaxID=582515 RepID=U5DK54_9CHRO|nr:hypothetical protein [Rubidibacter lacunae]ERN41292.1 hypothetical protein KR51_00021820 [Rubidibacter lacunae KORDI 51-2]
MKSSSVNYLLEQLVRLQQRSRSHQRGFTLLELIVATLMSLLIVGTLLSMVIDVFRTNTSEEVQTETQQEIDAALDYIARDLREAVFVYTGDDIEDDRIIPQDDGDVTVDSFGAQLAIPNNSGETVVLALWIIEDLPYNGDDDVANLLPSDTGKCPTGSLEVECKGLGTERRAFSLVFYTIDTSVEPTWEGPAIIRRTILRKYDALDSSGAFDLAKGYVDPRKDGSSFKFWPFDNEGIDLQGDSIDYTKTKRWALVDRVDDPNNTDPNVLVPNCPAGYSRSPRAGGSIAHTSFYACIRNRLEPNQIVVNQLLGGDEQAFNYSGGNQDVFVYLRGNPGKAPNGSSLPLPTLQTQVITRGVIQKLNN